jgi:predicted HTH domain antitoxin
MTVVLPDDPVTASFSPKDLQLELACALYARKRISMSQGARMAELERMDFQAALCDRDIPVHYSTDDLQKEMESFQALLPA